MAEKLNFFYQLLKTGVPIKITSELRETFESVNEALSDACEIALTHSVLGRKTQSNDRSKLQKRCLCFHGWK